VNTLLTDNISHYMIGYCKGHACAEHKKSTETPLKIDCFIGETYPDMRFQTRESKAWYVPVMIASK
jgi:hypothetical protein